MPVKYVSFPRNNGAIQGPFVEFLYNCVSDKTTQDTNNDVPDSTTVPNELSAVPLDCKFKYISRIFHHNFSKISVFGWKDLVKKCEIEEAWELEYKKFHEIKTLKNTQSEGYLFKMNFLVYGQREVHVLLSATEKPDIDKEAAYEIGK